MRYRPITLAGYLLAFSLAVIAFEVYGAITKPAVPRSIQKIVEQLGYGVPVGDRVKTIGEKYDVEPRFVPHLGYTFNLGPAQSGWPKSAQIWLLLDKKDREKKDPRRARVPAIAVLSREPTAPYVFAGNISYVFGAPAIGCVAMSEGRYRDVRYWMSKDSSGGIAVLSDFNPESLDGSRPPGGATAMLVFAGAFDSSRTLRGDYMAWPCKTASKIDHADHATSAAETALLAFAGGSATNADALPPYMRPAHPDALTDACAYPPAEGEGWHEVRAADLRIALPGRFPDTSSAGPYRPFFHYEQGGGTADIEIRPVRSESDIRVRAKTESSCTFEDSRGQVTVRVGESEHNYAELFVTAYFVPTGRPPFAIVAITHDSKIQRDLLHSVRTAMESAIWNIDPGPPPQHWKQEPRH